MFEIYFIIIIIAVFSIACLKYWSFLGKPGNYIILTILLVYFLAIYSVGFLGLKFTGNYLGMQTDIQAIEAEQKDLKEVTEILVQMIFENKERAGTFMDRSSEKFKERKNNLEELLDMEIKTKNY